MDIRIDDYGNFVNDLRVHGTAFDYVLAKKSVFYLDSF